MSVKVDVERSTEARTEGNASFKKGKWNEAIGHYTVAIVFNSQDGLGYMNRAAAYLKLEKWKDAERDCTTAIGLPKGKTNVKAFYRRSMARKGLDDLGGAIEDIKAVLAVEPTNDTAKEELAEMEETQRRTPELQEARAGKARETPLFSPVKPGKPPTPSSSHWLSRKYNKNPSPASTAVKASPNPLESIKFSFADLKKDRQVGKKTFTASATSPTPLVGTSSDMFSISPSTLPVEKASITDIPPPTTISNSKLSGTTTPLVAEASVTDVALPTATSNPSLPENPLPSVSKATNTDIAPPVTTPVPVEKAKASIADAPPLATSSDTPRTPLHPNGKAPSINVVSSTTTSKLSDTPLPLLDPTIPGSALSFISSIRTHSVRATWPVIAHLAKQPGRIGKMLDDILEPDQLALTLARLQETVNLDEGTKEERMESIKGFVNGLRMTSRWGMTIIMLSSKERQMGEDVWDSVGGIDDWTKRIWARA